MSSTLVPAKALDRWTLAIQSRLRSAISACCVIQSYGKPSRIRHHNASRGMTAYEQRGDLRKLALQVRNWGRWGADDEIGTLNYITPEKIAQASRLVTA